MNVSWIASYPKSGSTWLRFIANQLLFVTEDDVPSVRDAVPDMHDHFEMPRYKWKGMVVMKTHLPFHNLPTRLHTQSSICIIRNPLDVVDSTLAYLDQGDGVDREFILESFCEHGSIEPWLSLLNYGSWDGHAKSWSHGKHLTFPHMTLRYEDMLDDPHTGIRKIADFYEVEVSDERINDVVEKTSFNRMKKIEEEEISAGVQGFFTEEQSFEKKNFRFMRSGRSGGYMDNLTEEEVARLIVRFRPVMEEHGYL